MREKQVERVEKSEQVTVEDLWEVHEGVFAANMVNDRGEERLNVMMVPFRVTSETSDSIYRSEYVGKYLLACARENPTFRELLTSGIEVRINKLREQYKTSTERDSLADALRVTDDGKTRRAIYRRVIEINKEVGNKTPADIREEITNHEVALRHLNKIHLEGSPEEQENMSDEEIEDTFPEDIVVVVNEQEPRYSVGDYIE